MKPYRPTSSLPYIIAHRGISGKAPENTLAAFALALGTPGIDMIELDVRLTRDRHVIVLHDRTLQRTSTGNGTVYNHSVVELRRFDAGSWFHSSFAGQHVPTLDEVFALVAGKRWVNIELKADLFGRGADLLVENVLEVVRRQGMRDYVLYSSFSHDLIARIRRRDPEAQTGVIFNFYRDFGRSPSKLASRVGASVFVCGKHELRRSMVRDAHQHGLSLYVYTLNSVQDARKMVELGVNGIISDNADEIVDVVVGLP